MSIKIRLKSSLNEKLVKNHVFFTNQDFKISGFNKLSIFKSSELITKTINSNKLNDNNFLSFNINPTQKIILIKITLNLKIIALIILFQKKKISQNPYRIYTQKNNLNKWKIFH